MDQIIPHLTKEDFEKDEKARTVVLTDAGVKRVEELLVSAGLLGAGLGLYDIDNVALVHHINQALRAHNLYARDVDYIVKDDAVIIIDEFTGRMMEGRRYSEGLHQALEAKEQVEIQNETRRFASRPVPELFPPLSQACHGMTGTASDRGQRSSATSISSKWWKFPTNVSVKRSARMRMTRYTVRR